MAMTRQDRTGFRKSLISAIILKRICPGPWLKSVKNAAKSERRGAVGRAFLHPEAEPVTKSNQFEAKPVETNPGTQAPSRREEEELASPPQRGSLLGRPLFGGQERQANLLSNLNTPMVQRQRFAVQIRRMQGNRHMQRLVEQVSRRERARGSLVQRDPDDGAADHLNGVGIPPTLMTSVEYNRLSDDELGYRHDLIQHILMQLDPSSPDAQMLQEQAIQINGVLVERQVEARVREELEGFFDEFANITVTVSWGEDTGTHSVLRTEEVTVHPPYFMNVNDREEAHPMTLARYDAAAANRRAANRATRNLLNEYFRSPRRGGLGLRRARVGKSHPEDIRGMLQSALDRDLVQPGRGRDRPNGEDLRNWLIRYGVGVDCSGFVSQALNRVTEEIRGRPLAAGEQLKKGAAGLRGGVRRFTEIKDPAQLQPGDTMHIPGHIRIITNVRREAGGIVFVTAESRSGGRADVGPDRAEWRFRNGQLQMRRSAADAWSDSDEDTTFGRYDRLQEAMEQAAGTGTGPGASPP